MNMQVRGTSVLWLVIALFLAFAILLFRDILAPFIAALLLAYIFDPLADRLQRKKFSRLQATFLIFGVAVLAVILSLTFLIPLLVEQTADFINSLPALIKSLQDFVNQQIKNFQDVLGPQITARLRIIQYPFDSILNEAKDITSRFLGSLWTGGLVLFNALSFIVVTPLMACYLLYDWDRMIAAIDKLLPRRDAPNIRVIAAEINLALAAYLRGQALVVLLLGLIYAAGLTAIGLKSSLLLGLGAGLISFVPYLGNIFGGLTILLVALAQFGPDYGPFLVIAAVFAVGQLIDGYILQPRFIGGAVGVHPVWMIFALYAFGALFGFLGLLLAVPLAASIGVLLRHVIRYYTHSQLYLGHGERQRRTGAKAHP